MALTLAEANAVVQGAIDKAREINIKISVAVCDAGGRLMAFNRMDNAIWGSVYGSQGKAVASVAFARPSGELQERGVLYAGAGGLADIRLGYFARPENLQWEARTLGDVETSATGTSHHES